MNPVCNHSRPNITARWRGLLICAALLGPHAKADTQITTYVIKTQEERQQTRWSMTEWLRIKERMKMMDVWLALFSDPKKDKFQPELMLSASATRSTFNYAASNGQTAVGPLSGGAFNGQLWLTNLISNTIGIRTLNVDLGASAYHRRSSSFVPESSVGSGASASTPAGARKFELEGYSGAMRIFGRNIQDSSLVLNYGRYSLRNGITDDISGAGGDTVTGPMMAAEMQLYVLHSIGAEGNYVQYGQATETGGFSKVNGSYYDYQGFVEISLFRLVGGPYFEQWDLTTVLGDTIKTKEKGFIAGLKLQL